MLIIGYTELYKPFQEAIAKSWEDLHTVSVPLICNELYHDCERKVAFFHSNLDVMKSFDSCCAADKAFLDERIKALVETQMSVRDLLGKVTKDQRESSRKFTSLIQGRMMKAYDECYQVKGTLLYAVPILGV